MEERYSWKKVYIEIAKVIAKRSQDPHTKVGAVLVKDGCVIGIGYNGEPRNYNYSFDWNSEEKYKYCIHAEMNAIVNSNVQGISCKDADIYITLSPCTECIKLLIQHQIKHIYYLNAYKDIDLVKKIASGSSYTILRKINENGEVEEC